MQSDMRTVKQSFAPAIFKNGYEMLLNIYASLQQRDLRTSISQKLLQDCVVCSSAKQTP